jgi:hypothetical protein
MCFSQYKPLYILGFNIKFVTITYFEPAVTVTQRICHGSSGTTAVGRPNTRVNGRNICVKHMNYFIHSAINISNDILGALYLGFKVSHNRFKRNTISSYWNVRIPLLLSNTGCLWRFSALYKRIFRFLKLFERTRVKCVEHV